MTTDTLVSICLPVRNAGRDIEPVINSVLAQNHDRIELVISDNASTDDTEDVCREFVGRDARIVYHRQPENVGILENFVSAMRAAKGDFFRWIGDDDRLEPGYVTRCLQAFEADERLILVTTAIAYTGPDGTSESAEYHGGHLGSDDRVERFAEMLRLLNASHLLIDPLYGVMRRDVVSAIPRRNMLREDEVFAAKLALTGPWGHVPDVLAHRHWKHERIGTIAHKLGVPSWQSRASNTLQAREILSWLNAGDLTDDERARARHVVYRFYAGRQQQMLTRRTRKLMRLAMRR